MKPKLYIVTGNSLKFRELAHKLNEFFDCEQKSFNEPEIQGNPEEIIKHKLKQAYDVFKHPVLVDDTSVGFSDLKGFPGPYIRDFLKCFSSYEMGVKFVGSRIFLSSYLGIYDGKSDPVIAVGKIEGVVVKPKDIDPGIREFDLFVQADGTDRPMIEFTPEEKNKFSHRGIAMKNLLEILEKQKK